MSVLEKRKADGKQDIAGEEGKPLSPGIDKKAYGNNVQIELIGTPAENELLL